jgi:hypothetical protein
MKHGDKLIYRSYGFPQVFEFTIEALSVETIEAVECLKIYSSAAETYYSYYWIAEGISGNLWLLKEYDSEFNDTIFYGKENAKLIIPKNLSVGTILWQGLPDHLQELVIATGVTVPVLSTGLGPYYNCVKTIIDWGDGDLDYNYYAPDVGNVKFEFNDDGGINGFELKEISYGEGSAPSANFSANPMSGNAPLIVNFTDKSTGTITSWNWNFGDGASSAIQNPSHTYTKEGNYIVSLTVSSRYGSNTETKADYIKVAYPFKSMPWIPLLLLDE